MKVYHSEFAFNCILIKNLKKKQILPNFNYHFMNVNQTSAVTLNN